MLTATCTKCGVAKDLTDFHKDSQTSTGHRPDCKACVLARHKKRYAEDPAFREKVKAQWRDWRAAHPGEEAASAKARYLKNPEKHHDASRQWRADHPEQAKENRNRRRARKRCAPGHATAEQIKARCEFWNNACWICGGPYEHLDHVKPLAKGGSGWPANLRPACAFCNLSKHATKLPTLPNTWPPPIPKKPTSLAPTTPQGSVMP